MKRILVAVITMTVLLVGCQPIQRVSPDRTSEPTDVVDTTEVFSSYMPKEPDSGLNEIDNTMKETSEGQTGNEVFASSLTVGGFIGECTYTVDSWTVYESWAEAGISEDALSSSYPVDDSGILLVTLTQHCDSRSEMSQGHEDMTVGGFQPVAREQIDAAREVSDLQKYLYIDTDIGSPACYFDQASTGEREYFYCPIPNAGEAVTYTLGFVLSETTRAAAEDGTLLLWYTTNGVPATADELLLLALGGTA